VTTDARTAAGIVLALASAGQVAVASPSTSRPMLIVSDFDGTLSELVDDPWAATIVPAARRALRRLVATRGVEVALLSGRGVADLAGRARVGGVRYLGDHGAEWAVARRGFRPVALRAEREPASLAEAGMAARLCLAVPQAVPEAWLIVEAKGPAVTFHFRAAPDVDAARVRVLEAVDLADPQALLRRSGGRRSLELRPAGASDKGSALRRLIVEHEPRVVIMLGDDHTDVLAFEALREARAAGRVDGLAIAVVGRPDVSAAVAPQADLRLASPREATRFLRLLSAGLGVIPEISERRAPATAAPAPPPRPPSTPGPPG
jgi:trehalose-phosphatase